MSEKVSNFIRDRVGCIDGWYKTEEGEMRSPLMDAIDAVEAIESENAKLLELSSIMLKCIMANERKMLICWKCPMHKQFDELRSYCCLEHEAKELGIEVD